MIFNLFVRELLLKKIKQNELQLYQTILNYYYI